MEVISVYGIQPFTPEQIEVRENEVFAYLKALIQAELINPENEYDKGRQISLLKKIAISPISFRRRTELVTLLLNDENIEDEN